MVEQTELLEIQAQQSEIEALTEQQEQIAEERAKNHPQFANLAGDFSGKDLDNLSKTVIEDFESDWASYSDWREMHAFWLELYYQADKAISDEEDRDWGATESVPILTEACNQFAARTSQAFFPSKNFVSAIPTGEANKVTLDRGRRVGRHMSFQLSSIDRKYKKNKRRLFLSVALHGSFFTKTYYDPDLGRFRVDNVRPSDLVIPYNVGPVEIEDVPRKTHRTYLYKHQYDRLVSKGFFIEGAEVSTDIEPSETDKVIDDAEGKTPGVDSNKDDSQAGLIEVLEQHRFIEMKDRPVPVIVSVDKQSQKIIRIAINYEVNASGQPIDDFKPLECFTHYKFFENPDGFYGLALGHFIGDINAAVNIMLRQNMDAATLANEGNSSGLISERIAPEGEEITMSLGKFKTVPENAGNISNGILQFKFPGPNAAHINLMQFLVGTAQRLASTTEALTGAVETNKQATTILTEVEQGLQIFTSVQSGLADSLSDELQKIFHINSRYLPVLTYFVVNGETQEIAKSDYTKDMLVEAIFDPRFATQQQKVARGNALREFALTSPTISQNPEAMKVVERNWLRTLEYDDELIEQIVPDAPESESFDDQTVENMFFLMPPGERPLFDVFPDHDHQAHIAEIDVFVNSEFGQQLTPEAAQELLTHRQKHLAFLFGQEQGILDEGIAGEVGQGELGGLAGASGDVGIAQIPGETLSEAEALGSGDLGGTQTFGGSIADIRRSEETG